MALISLEFVKNHFPKWKEYFVDENGVPDQRILEDEIILAEAELMNYIDSEAEEISDSLKIHLINIIRKRGYDRTNLMDSNEFFSNVVLDYNKTIAILNDLKLGKISLEKNLDDKIISVNNNSKKLNGWFTE